MARGTPGGDQFSFAMTTELKESELHPHYYFQIPSTCLPLLLLIAEILIGTDYSNSSHINFIMSRPFYFHSLEVLTRSVIVSNPPADYSLGNGTLVCTTVWDEGGLGNRIHLAAILRVLEWSFTTFLPNPPTHSRKTYDDWCQFRTWTVKMGEP